MAYGNIYTGVWTNWSRGRVFGWTVTLSPTYGTVLSTFLAIFIGSVAIQLWKLVCFVLYELRASKNPRDALYHQHQLTLRNTSDPYGSAWSFVQQMWRWRSRASGYFLRSLCLVAISSVYFSLSAFLGVFIPTTITSSPGSERLLATSQNCGFVEAGDWNLTARWRIKQLQSRAALTYVDSCHRQQIDGWNSACSVYQKPYLAWTAEPDVPCPFQDRRICNGTVHVSTDLLDSDSDFGINAPPEDRIQFKATATCAPLIQNDRWVTIGTEEVAQYERVPRKDILLFKYGSFSGLCWDFCQIYHNLRRAWSLAYKFTGTGDNSFVPAPGLIASNADTQLFWIEFNSLSFEYSNHDTVFGTSPPDPKSPTIQFGWHGNEQMPLRRSWNDVAFLACATKQQICDSRTGSCTDSVPAQLLTQAVNKQLKLSRRQLATFGRISSGLQLPMHNIVEQLSVGALDFDKHVQTTMQFVQGHISSEQWQIEIRRIFSIFLAQMQGNVHRFASGEMAGWKRPWHTVQAEDPHVDIYKEMCSQQKTNAALGTVSFSLLGVTLVFGIGSVLIFLSLALPSLVASSRQKWWPQANWRSQSWRRDSNLQLHREAHGQAVKWLPGMAAIPLTVKGEKWASIVSADEEPTIEDAPKDDLSEVFTLTEMSTSPKDSGLVKISAVPNKYHDHDKQSAAFSFHSDC